MKNLNPGLLDTGADPADLEKPPFRIIDGLAMISSKADDGACLVVPTTNETLVEPAEFEGKPAKFFVPSHNGISSTFGLSPFGNRRGPEFVHVRTEVNSDDTTTDLNLLDDVESKTRGGDYFAQHYLDHTADGWVKVEIPQLESEIDRFSAAFSLISAPDFFPLVNQRHLTEWTESTSGFPAPGAILRDEIWSRQPEPLCDDRLPPNQQLPESLFTPDDDTVTAIVAMDHEVVSGSPVAASMDPMRRTHLPDDAAGLFAPGWDVSIVKTGVDDLEQFASYGLGSPFPEDAKLCAALSAFWPAVAPDIARSVEPPFSSVQRTVVPLVDEEIGIGTNAVAWDGLDPLKELTDELEYPSMQHADYVRKSLSGEFSLSVTGRISTQGYIDRILATAMLYRTLSNHLDGHGPNSSLLYSFFEVSTSDSELIDAQTGLAVLLSPVFAVKVSSTEGQDFTPPSAMRVRIKKHNTATLFVSANGSTPFVLYREDTGADAGQWKLDSPLGAFA